MAPPMMHVSASIIIGRAWVATLYFPVVLEVRIRHTILTLNSTLEYYVHYPLPSLLTLSKKFVAEVIFI